MYRPIFYEYDDQFPEHPNHYAIWQSFKNHIFDRPSDYMYMYSGYIEDKYKPVEPVLVHYFKNRHTREYLSPVRAKFVHLMIK